MIFYIGPQRFLDEGISYCKTADAARYLKGREVIQLDLETTSLDPITGSIRLLQLGTHEHQFVFDMRNGLTDEIRELVELEGVEYVGHNIKFDVKFLLSQGVTFHNVWDTYVMDRVIFTGDHFGRGFKLSDVAMRRLGIYMPKEMQSSFIDHEGDFSAAQIRYAAKDVEHLQEIRAQQIEELVEAKLMLVAKLENAVLLSFADLEHRGLMVDAAAWGALATEAEDLRDSLVDRMDDMILTRPELERWKPQAFQVSMFGTEREDLRDSIRVKWSSQKDVLPIIQALTSEGLESLDTKVLKREFGGCHNLVDSFIDYVDVNKKATSFGHEWISKYVEADGRVRTSIDQIMATGRVSSHAPNLQQVPSDSRYRDCFVPSPGCKFITTDYGSQELVVIASGAKDEVWLEALKHGHDLHSICAALVFADKWAEAAEEGCAFEASHSKCGCPEHKKMRNRTKAISFGLAYGAGPGSLAESLQISKADAEKLVDDYFSAFPRIKAWLDGNARLAVRRRESRTFAPYGRRRLYETGEIDFKTRGMIDRRGRNTVIQGTSADMTKTAQVLLRKRILAEPGEAWLVAAVHDELLLEVREGLESKWADIVQTSMEEAARIILGHDLLKAEPEIGHRWAK